MPVKSFKQYFERNTYYNDTLHPKFWSDEKFNEDVLKSLLKTFSWAVVRENEYEPVPDTTILIFFSFSILSSS